MLTKFGHKQEPENVLPVPTNSLVQEEETVKTSIEMNGGEA